MEQSFRIKYPLKVWLLTILGTPFIFTVIKLLQMTGTLDGFLEALPLPLFMVFFSSILSLPALIFYWLLFEFLQKKHLKNWTKKVILSSNGIVLILLTFFLFNKGAFFNRGQEAYFGPLYYSIPLVLFTFILKMPTSSYQNKKFQN